MSFKEFHTISGRERNKIIKKVKKLLFMRKEIIFAYLFGSFLEDYSFRDIDIGIYVDRKIVKKNQTFEYQLNLSKELNIPSKYLMDIRVINDAPFSFLSSVFKRGKLLFSKIDVLLTDLIEKVSFEASISESFARKSFQELIS